MRLKQIIPFIFILACQNYTPETPDVTVDWEQFGDYWYQGEGELTSYRLTQARYGEYREGEAVLVFVTEPFSLSKQVKLDRPDAAGKDKVSVMKMNFSKKFITGVYPYSMMTSSFVPVSFVEYPDALKVTTTSQEWCGHTFTQLNHAGKDYRFRQFSYFESEGDVDKAIENQWLEDELWQRLKINPGLLPEGEITILPSTMYLRLSHEKPEVVSASARLIPRDSSEFFEESHFQYQLKYPKREMNIFFGRDFPYPIFGWKETYSPGFGGGQEMTTTAKRIKTIKSPYWTKNSIKDSVLRKELGLQP